MRQVDLVQELIGVKSQEERIRIVKYHYKCLPKTKKQSLKKQYPVIRTALYETESAEETTRKIRGLGIHLYGSFSLTYQLASIAAGKPVILPQNELKRMKKRKMKSMTISDPNPKDITEKVKSHYESLTESELDNYKRFFLKANEALDRNRTVHEAQQYLERKGEFPFGDSLFSIHYQIACLAAGEEARTPQRELSKKARRISYSNGIHKRLGAILLNTQRTDGFDSPMPLGYSDP